MAQLKAIVFLTRQGSALRGHTESEGNLSQLMQMMSKDNAVIQSWLRNNCYTSHLAVNEVIDSLGLTAFRKLLSKIKAVTGPAWFSIIAYEATDVINTEQLNLSICWVSDDYEAHEDPMGLYRVPNTKAETLWLFRISLSDAICY